MKDMGGKSGGGGNRVKDAGMGGMSPGTMTPPMSDAECQKIMDSEKNPFVIDDGGTQKKGKGMGKMGGM